MTAMTSIPGEEQSPGLAYDGDEYELRARDANGKPESFASDYETYDDYLADTLGDTLDRPPTCCDQFMVWVSRLTGRTCGGLHLRGAWLCRRCSSTQICRMSKPYEQWRVTGHQGVSVETSMGRIRIDGPRDTETAQSLAKRIAALPELELEVERLRALIARRPA